MQGDPSGQTQRWEFTELLGLDFLTGYAQSAHIKDYIPGALYVKFQPHASRKSHGGSSVDEVLANFGAVDIQPAFTIPGNSGSRKMSVNSRDRLDSIASIKRVNFPKNLDMEYVAKKLSAHPDIEYAEPIYKAELCVLPNDPFYNNPDPTYEKQEYLNFINAPQAWDTAKGDASVVIAIVDAGTDWNHPDLRENLWTNIYEIPDNGLDDDENGFKDDVHGWDFYGSEDLSGNIEGDNDPTSTNEPHGTHVAGIAAAVTDNGVGIASLSYNVRYMPVKAGPDDGDVLYLGYEAVMYAASNGADIINCSWGSPQFSRTGADVFGYAISEGAVIVASAGNNNTNWDYYPAAYPGVIGVGSIEIDGIKSSFSNYGSYVDISAPGSRIFSTLLDDSYGSLTGTSMSAPVVSALAALIKSAHPDWDSDHIQAQILGTASPVIAGDPYNYLCGCGYVNAEEALGKPVLLIHVVDFEFTDTGGNNDGLFTPGEEIEAAVTIRNYGEQVDNVSFDITSITGFTAPEITNMNVGTLDHGKEKTITNIPFIVAEDAPYDARDFIRLDFETSDGEINFSTINVMVSPSYMTLTANKIELSVDDKGHIGYIDYPENTKGSSFIVRNDSPAESNFFDIPLLFEGGLLIGNSENRISDVIRSSEQLVPKEDFILISPVQFEKAPDGSMQTGTVVFSDEGAGEERYNITVTLKTFAYNEPEHDQYIILAYNFRNDSNKTLTGLRAGLFFDFDIPESYGDDDAAFYSEKDDILILTGDTSEQSDKLMVGAAVSGSIYTPWIIENASHDSVFFGIYDGYTDEEKWRSLSAGKHEENKEGYGDVSIVISPESFTLEPGRQKQEIFLLAYGLGYDDLKSQVNNARMRAEQISVMVEDMGVVRYQEQFSIKSIYPNPFNASTNISFHLPEASDITVTVFDILGRKVDTVFSGYKVSGEHALLLNGERLASGIYFVGLEAESGLQSFRKITVLK